MAVNDGDVIEMAAVTNFDNTGEVINVWQFRASLPTATDEAIIINDILVVLEALYGIVVGFQTLLQV